MWGWQVLSGIFAQGLCELNISLQLRLMGRVSEDERIDGLAFWNMRGFALKCLGFTTCMMLAGCFGSSSGQTAQDIVEDLPDEIVPIVIENEEEIREIIDRELDDDLQEEANEIIDLIVAVTTTTVSATSISATTGTR